MHAQTRATGQPIAIGRVRGQSEVSRCLTLYQDVANNEKPKQGRTRGPGIGARAGTPHHPPGEAVFGRNEIASRVWGGGPTQPRPAPPAWTRSRRPERPSTEPIRNPIGNPIPKPHFSRALPGPPARSQILSKTLSARTLIPL